MKLSLIYITNPDLKTAQRIARHLLQKRLVAGVNIFPIRSMYWWKGKLEQAREQVVIAKTLPNNFQKVKREATKLHPYQVPCIIKIEAICNKDFYCWLKNEVK